MAVELKVEKRLSEAEIEMADGTLFVGHFYLSDQARHHLGHENVMDILNQPDDDFIPFHLATESSLLLLQKRQIRSVHLRTEDFSEVFALAEGEAGTLVPVLLNVSGKRLEGKAFVGDLHPDRRRLKDLLNTPTPFFLFRSDQETRIVNKHLINFAVPR